MCVSCTPRASMRSAVFVSSFQNVALPVCAASVPLAESMRWNHATPPVPRKAAFQVSGEENSHEGRAFHAADNGEAWLCSIRHTMVVGRTVKVHRSVDAVRPMPGLMPLDGGRAIGAEHSWWWGIGGCGSEGSTLCCSLDAHGCCYTACSSEHVRTADRNLIQRASCSIAYPHREAVSCREGDGLRGGVMAHAGRCAGSEGEACCEHYNNEGRSHRGSVRGDGGPGEEVSLNVGGMRGKVNWRASGRLDNRDPFRYCTATGSSPRGETGGEECEGPVCPQGWKRLFAFLVFAPALPIAWSGAWSSLEVPRGARS